MPLIYCSYFLLQQSPENPPIPAISQYFVYLHSKNSVYILHIMIKFNSSKKNVIYFLYIYLFLSICPSFGTASMADTGARTGTKPTEENISKGKSNKEDKTSKENSNESMTPFSQDIKNNPYLWFCLSLGSIANFCILYLFYAIIVKYEYKSAMDAQTNNKTWNNEDAWDNVKFGGQLILVILMLYTVISMLLASWESLWVNEGEKEEERVVPSFKVRFWRSFRFMLPLILINPIMNALKELLTYIYPKEEYMPLLVVAFSPCIISLTAYVSIEAYDALSKKAIHEKDDLSANRKNESMTLLEKIWIDLLEGEE